MRKLFLGLLALIPVISLCSFTTGESDDAPEKKVAKATKLVDGFMEIKGTSADGAEVKLSDFLLQDKYVLVDFWASWCGPCKEETPFVISTYEQYKDKGLVVVGIAVSDKKADSIKAIGQLNIPYPQILEADSNAVKAYGVRTIPNLFLFAPDGSIVAKGMRGNAISQTVKKNLK